MRKLAPIIFGASVALGGCNIRAVAMIETEDAVYGNTKIEKVQKYDPKQRHLDFTESVMGTVNSDTLDSLGRIVNGGQSEDLRLPASKSVPTVTTVPPGNTVIVQP